MCTQQTSALLKISQVSGSLSSVFQIHSGKHCPSPVPPESRSSPPVSQCWCLFFLIALLLWGDSKLPGWRVHVQVQTAALGCRRRDRHAPCDAAPWDPATPAGSRLRWPQAAPACCFSAQSGTLSNTDSQEELHSASILKFN